jgi:hypothetical protein
MPHRTREIQVRDEMTHSCIEDFDLEFPFKESVSFEGMAGMPEEENMATSVEKLLLRPSGRRSLQEEEFDVTYQEDDAIVMVRRR